MSQQRVIPRETSRPKGDGKSSKQRVDSVKTTAFYLQRAFDAIFGHLKASATSYRRGWSRYKRHQGVQEKARRVRQIERGIIRITGRAKHGGTVVIPAG